MWIRMELVGVPRSPPIGGSLGDPCTPVLQIKNNHHTAYGYFAFSQTL